ncbi:hypothetical protein BOX15_Mlig006337g1 [Macrostomum lignano]|uniref:Centrosomal protein of 89 kDa n=1 Tax=Macrostomum lignano TaxID=282301 RepID=A0A267E9H5_9PLAT|nr:hypothetical protein BOX15_Mlig006337g1 [Macrostomum lignano]
MAQKLSPFNCMKRHKKPSEPANPPVAKKEEVPEPIDELMDEPGYARIQSMMEEDSNQNPAEDEEEDDEDDEEIEEAVEASVAIEAHTSLPVYADVKKGSSAAASSTSPRGPAVPQKSESAVPTPRSSRSNPVASQRSPRRVGFHGDDDVDAAGPSNAAGAAAEAELRGNDGSRLLTGVSLNSYGLGSSMHYDQSTELTESARSYSQQQQPQQQQQSYNSHQSQDPSDVQSLKRTIRRLTSEMSRLLTNPGDAYEARRLLPGKGPVPPWLCDARTFAPLLAAYESQLADRDEARQRCETRLQLLEAEVADLVRENERLRLKIKEGVGAAQAAQDSNLDEFTEQARLVLEENQLLIHQLSLQQERAKQAHKNYVTDTTKLKNRCEELEAENAELRTEQERLRLRLQEVKAKYQSAVIDREDEDLETVDRVKELHRELLDVRSQHKQAMEEVTRQLQNSERERTRLAEDLADTAAEKEKLTVEVVGLKNALQTKHRDNIVLQKFVKKHNKLQKYLDSVVSAATNLQSERDAFRAAMEEQEQQLARLANQLIEELKLQNVFNERSKSKIDEELDDTKPSIKLEKLIQTIVTLLKENEGKRDDLEKEVRYQQSLLRQKTQQLESAEAERRTVEDQLEDAWNTAVAN